MAPADSLTPEDVASLPQLVAHQRWGPYCAEHWAGEKACEGKSGSSCRDEKVRRQTAEDKKPHLLYLHAQK